MHKYSHNGTFSNPNPDPNCNRNAQTFEIRFAGVLETLSWKALDVYRRILTQSVILHKIIIDYATSNLRQFDFKVFILALNFVFVVIIIVVSGWP